MSISSIIKNRREEVINIAQKNGAKNVRVFGSMARGEENAESDLDIIAIKQDIEELLGRKVDVVTEASISPYIRDAVLKEAVNL